MFYHNIVDYVWHEYPIATIKWSWIYHLLYLMENYIGYKKNQATAEMKIWNILVYSTVSIKSISVENISSNYIFFKHYFFFGMPFKPNEGTKVQEKTVFRWDTKIIILLAQFLNLPHHPWKRRWKIWEFEKNIRIRYRWFKEVIETKWNKSSAFAILSTLQNLVMNQNLRDIKWSCVGEHEAGVYNLWCL